MNLSNITKKEIKAFLMEESSLKTREFYNKSIHKLLDNEPNVSKNIGIWTKSELIDDNREGSKGWRQFSLTDLVWIELLRKLKKNRFDKIVLHAVKNELNKFQDEISKMPLLDMNIMKALNIDNNLIFSINHSGKFSFIEKDTNNTRLIDMLINRTNIDFTSLINKLKDKHPSYFELEVNPNTNNEVSKDKYINRRENMNKNTINTNNQKKN